MKKGIILLVVIVLTLSFLIGCKKAGQAVEMPSDPNQPGFGVERSVYGNTVTLTIYRQALASNEIVIIAEKLPDGITYDEGSSSITPTFHDDTLLIWLFAVNAPQQLGELTINDAIPTTITYRTNTAPGDAEFRGKWGLKELNIEGLIGDDVSPGGPVTILDVLNAISNYKSAAISILDLLNIIEQYKAGL